MSNERTASEDQAIEVIRKMYIQYQLLKNKLNTFQNCNQNNYHSYLLALHHLGLAVHHARELVMDLIQESFIFYVREEQSLREVVLLDHYYAMWESAILDIEVINAKQIATDTTIGDRYDSRYVV
jgi:hypothetical protein